MAGAESSGALGAPVSVVVATEVAGAVVLALVCTWLYAYRGGVSFSSSYPDALFNLHPLLMTLGLVFLFGQGVLAYRVLPYSKPVRKRIHLALTLTGLALALVALWAVVVFHNAKGIPNFYSLHSWMGVATLALFAVQWLVGLTTFFYPGAPQPTRALVMPWHTFLGLFIFVLALVTASQGILEKATFLGLEKYGSELNLANWLGLSLFAYGALVLLTATSADRARADDGYQILQ